MLPQHDPLFMQAPADHEEKWKGKTFHALLGQIATLCTIYIIQIAFSTSKESRLFFLLFSFLT